MTHVDPGARGEQEKPTPSYADLVRELRIIAEADPSKWEPDVRGQFREWAQSRARAAVRKAEAR